MDIDEMHARLVAELRALRTEAGLTLRELSLKVHVSDSSLSRYFAGQALPPWEVVATLTDLGGGNHAEMRRLWDEAQRERRQSRWPAAGSPAEVVAAERRLGPVVGICALIAASGAVGWALGRR
ncbi:helix-turn-helix domain-containing protein [Paractinoplanes lichenicola]|uniref:Helix-turn-helix domain-containing protein n=1 Tax=Paractinoplanes lichenicola TaxID=2802976 RepID=A0ABS1VZ95_9ACTN|nr:helix-turn-helix domain-containing protein [Actinoplanes lichenicola]MBL7259817.1 helix-turn-helix domain-containing protein [Actinoplanes lichenicola]